MTVCRFYQQGYCRYGNGCKFEHPPKGGQQQQSNYNRFGALSGQSNQGMSGRGAAADTAPYPGLTADAIRRDLAEELPQWILSCYGPGRDAPEQLWGGYPREQSTEEIRLHFMLGAMAGNPQGALNDIQSLHQNAQQQIQHTLNNIPSAIQFIVDAGKSHPNRVDICKGAAGGTAPGAAPGGAFGGSTNAFQQTAPPANPFGAPAASTTTAGAFGQPAALGQKPNPFGAPASAPAFGQPTQPAASAFGQPATLGGTTAFGRPSQTTGAFGQPAALGAKPNPFGAPAQPAQPAFGQSGFGQPATLGAKPNPFGASAGGGGAFATAQPTPASNPFGQPAQQAQTAPLPFGQQANNQPANPFGQPATAPVNAFGQPATTQANPFGQPTTAAANPFGQPQQQPATAPANPFGQPQQQQAANPFGAPTANSAPANPFGAPAANTAPANPFGQPATTSPFGQPTTTTATQPPNPFGAQPSTSASTGPPTATPTGPGPYAPTATRQHPDITSYAAYNPDKTLRMFKGKPVFYEEPRGGGKPVPVLRNFDGSTVRIWMPNGAPPYTTQTEAAEPREYEDAGVMQQWRAFAETGRFAGGVMPEVPPRREFCSWDF